MVTQKLTIRLDESELPEIRMVSGDVGREIQIEVYAREDSENPIDLETYSADITLIKPDNTFIMDHFNVDKYELPENAGAVSGSGYYQIKIFTAGSHQIYTGQGRFLVDDMILSDDVIESSSIAFGDRFPEDFATKEWVDDEIEAAGTGTYVAGNPAGEETMPPLVRLQINDDIYPLIHKIEEQEDADITAPADGDVLIYDADDQKWKNEPLDIPDPTVTKTATGNPIEFSDGADAPLVKCVTQITGSQDLHGYDKPWVGGAGKNKFGGEYNQFFPLHFSSEVTITASANPVSGVNPQIAYFDENKTQIDYWGMSQQYSSVSNRVARTFTYPTTAYYVKFITNETTDYQIEVSSTNTTFAPYSNICPITAYTEGEIEVRGKNILNPNSAISYGSGSSTYSVSGNAINVTTSGQYSGIVFDKELPNGTYSISFSFKFNNSGTASVAIVDEDNTTSLWTTGEFSSDTTRSGNFTVTHGIAHIRFYCTRSNASGNVTISNLMLNTGSSSENYEEFRGTTHTTTYPSAIYRGSEDCVKGEVTTEWGMIASYAGETLPGEWISDREEYAPGTTPTTGAQVAYALATPTTSSVTPTNLPIKSLSGYNHIESSTGDMEIEYITQTYDAITAAPKAEYHKLNSSSIAVPADPGIVVTLPESIYSYDELVITADPDNAYYGAYSTQQTVLTRPLEVGKKYFFNNAAGVNMAIYFEVTSETQLTFLRGWQAYEYTITDLTGIKWR